MYRVHTIVLSSNPKQRYLGDRWDFVVRCEKKVNQLVNGDSSLVNILPSMLSWTSELLLATDHEFSTAILSI